MCDWKPIEEKTPPPKRFWSAQLTGEPPIWMGDWYDKDGPIDWATL